MANDDRNPLKRITVDPVILGGKTIVRDCNVDKPRNLAKSVTVE